MFYAIKTMVFEVWRVLKIVKNESKSGPKRKTRLNFGSDFVWILGDVWRARWGQNEPKVQKNAL